VTAEQRAPIKHKLKDLHVWDSPSSPTLIEPNLNGPGKRNLVPAELRSLTKTESPDLVEALLQMSQRVAVLEKQALQNAPGDRSMAEEALEKLGEVCLASPFWQPRSWWFLFPFLRLVVVTAVVMVCWRWSVVRLVAGNKMTKIWPLILRVGDAARVAQTSTLGQSGFGHGVREQSEGLAALREFKCIANL
jgi:hypothetical protein